VQPSYVEAGGDQQRNSPRHAPPIITTSVPFVAWAVCPLTHIHPMISAGESANAQRRPRMLGSTLRTSWRACRVHGAARQWSAGEAAR
jgi:hypothetical protein